MNVNENKQLIRWKKLIIINKIEKNKTSLPINEIICWRFIEINLMSIFKHPNLYGKEESISMSFKFTFKCKRRIIYFLLVLINKLADAHELNKKKMK